MIACLFLGIVSLFVSRVLSPRERFDFVLIDKPKFDSFWIEGLTNFSKNPKNKILISTIYNLNKPMQAKFLEDLALNIDNSISTASSITIMGYLNLNHLSNREKIDNDTATVPYGLNIACPDEASRVYKPTSTHLD